MAYDRVDWHSEGDYPDDLPLENGGTHIGMFLAWIINHHLEGEIHHDKSSDALVRVRSRQMTGREFLTNECDDKFWKADLCEEGNAFAKWYYESEKYFEDYESILCNRLPSIYYIEDTWDNYDRLAKIIDSRFAEWKRESIND